MLCVVAARERSDPEDSCDSEGAEDAEDETGHCGSVNLTCCVCALCRASLQLFALKCVLSVSPADAA